MEVLIKKVARSFSLVKNIPHAKPHDHEESKFLVEKASSAAHEKVGQFPREKKKITHSKPHEEPHEESGSSWKKPHEVLVENRFPHEDFMRKWANFLVKSNSS